MFIMLKADSFLKNAQKTRTHTYEQRRKIMNEKWHKMGMVALGNAIEAQKINPIELTEYFLDRLRNFSESAKIFVHITAGRARAEAQTAANRAKSSIRRTILDGVPISWKDLFDIENMPSEGGSALLAGNIATQDCEVLKRATQAGLVALGKTHMSELAFSGLGVNPITKTPPNINDPKWAPGGSSSGAGASVAFGLCAGAIGSDTGGSVRVPAAWNDLVGLKTTASLIPCTGVLPLCSDFDTIGPIGRNIEDMSAIFGILTDKKAPNLENVSLKNMRFLVLDVTALGETAPHINDHFANVINDLRTQGATIEIKTLRVIEDALALAPVLFPSQAYANWRALIESAPHKMFPEILKRFRAGANISACDYIEALQRLKNLRDNYHQESNAFDAVLLPTCPIMPPEIDHLLRDNTYYQDQNLRALSHTRIANLMGICSLSLPTGAKSIGIMLLGQAFGEEKLLRVGRAIEVALCVK